MTAIPRMSAHTMTILRIMLERHPQPLYSEDLRVAAGMPPGMVYPVLHRLRSNGWATRYWEDIDPITANRPRRCAYTLTALGHTIAAIAHSDQSAHRSRDRRNSLDTAARA